MRTIPVEDLIPLLGTVLLFDVRTPAEFESGHIPGAINLPLFSNEERAIIGTLYKQAGREEAIKKGLELIGPRMRGIVEEVEQIQPSGKIIFHCWRGGMRSGSIAWLLDLYGYDVLVLKRGYKAFRTWALKQFETPKNTLILGGRTGSAKTQILHELKNLSEQVVDLEALACHKGSAFGWINEQTPPTQEQFENELAVQWYNLDSQKHVWIEDESRTIGKKVIPENLWLQMRSSPVVFTDVPLEERIDFLVKTYGTYKQSELEESILKIERRLGNQAAREAVTALQEGNLAETARILLVYYDKTYQHGLEKRDIQSIHRIPCSITDIRTAALHLKNVAGSISKFFIPHS